MLFKNVKKAMIDQDLNVTKLAKATGYTRNHISNVINGHVESIKVKKVIALVLGKEDSKLWDNTQRFD